MLIFSSYIVTFVDINLMLESGLNELSEEL